MTKTFKRIIFAAIMLILIAGIACALVLASGLSTTAGEPLADVKNGFVNTALDVSGIKDRVDSELRSKAGKLAEKAGIPEVLAESVVDSIDVKDWKATSLPEGVTAAGTYAITAGGIDMKVTTYDDPSVVTVGAYGQEVTMAVPESAQIYVPYLEYLQYLKQ